MSDNKLKDLMIEVGFDVSDVEKNIKKLDKMFDNLGRNFQKKVKNSVNNDAFGLGAETKKAKLLLAELKSLNAEAKKLGSYKNKLGSAKDVAQMKKVTAELQKQKDILSKKATANQIHKNINQNIPKPILQKIDYSLDDKAILKQKAKRIEAEKEFRKFESEQAQKALKQRLREHKSVNKNRTLHAKRSNQFEQKKEQITNTVMFRTLGRQDVVKFNKELDRLRANFIKTGKNTGFATLSRNIREASRATNQLNKDQQKLRQSMKANAQIFAAMSSAATVGLGSYVNKVGSDIQGQEAAFLAVFGKDSTDQLEYIKELTERLGIDYIQAAKSYSKFAASTREKLGIDQTEQLFSAVSDYATALRVDPEALKGAYRALGQIAAKGQLMSEELKGQLSEHLPNAMQITAKALGVTTQELFKMMEKGELLAEDVLPKMTKGFYEAARANGALDKAVGTAAAHQQRLRTQAQLTAKKIFESGFEEGLVELYKEFTKTLKENGHTAENIGDLYRKLFKLITASIKVLTPVFNSFINVLDKSTDGLEDIASAYSFFVGSVSKGNKDLEDSIKLATGIALAFSNVWGRVALAIGAVEEFISLFDDNLVGAIEERLGYQINIATGKTQQLISVGDEVFDPMTYRALLKEDKERLSQEDFTKKHNAATVEEALLRELGTSNTADIVKLQNGEDLNKVEVFTDTVEIIKGLDAIESAILVLGSGLLGFKAMKMVRSNMGMQPVDWNKFNPLKSKLPKQNVPKSKTQSPKTPKMGKVGKFGMAAIGAYAVTEILESFDLVDEANRKYAQAVGTVSEFVMGLMKGSPLINLVMREGSTDPNKATTDNFYLDKYKQELESLRVDNMPEGTFTDAAKAAELMQKIDRLEKTMNWRKSIEPSSPSEPVVKEMIRQPISPPQPQYQNSSQNITLNPNYNFNIEGKTGDVDEQQLRRIVTEVNNATQEAIVQSYNSYRRGN